MGDLLQKFKRCLSLEEKYKHVENDGSYYTERRYNKLSIYFEWSNGTLDWIHNFYFPAKPYRDMENTWFCHRGFLKVWKSIEPYIADKIMNPEIDTIEIVGYSHGGAIAQLCYEYIKYNRPDVKVTGVGFGAPRVLWGTANKKVLDRFQDFIVVRNGNDLITHLPPVLFGFRHVARVWKVGKHWSFKDFVAMAKERGLKNTMKNHGHIGCIRDHYEQSYKKGLRE